MKSIVYQNRFLSPGEALSAGADEADPLDMGVGDVDTSFPKLQPGLYDVEVDGVEINPSKATEGAEVMKLTYKTTQDATDTRGEHVNKGFPLYDYVALTPTQGGNGKQPYTAKDIAKKLATIAQVCGLTTETPRQIIDAKGAQLVGKVIRIKVGLSKETAEFPESNKVKQYVPVE